MNTPTCDTPTPALATALDSTLAAIAILEQAYDRLLSSDTPSVVRQILLRAKDRLSKDAKASLTGGA